MDNKKEQERAELHRTIWSIADDLRGSVDGWDFKQYIFGIMFYRYISENIANYINQNEVAAGNADFDYAKLDDKQAIAAQDTLVDEKGFFILPSELFCNVRENAKNDKNLNETLERIFRNIETSAQGTDSEDDFKGLFDDVDVNSNKLGGTVEERNTRLVALLEGVGKMQLGNYQDNTIDAFGDAYEYVMSMYASSAGKSGGEFFTPQEVSELLTKITLVGKTKVNKVYDPACGSGSLLLNFAKILGKENVQQGFFGQEINITTYNLCRINMFLHDIDYNKFDIAHGDTLKNPKHWDDEPFEAIVSNPPYSIKWEGDGNPVLINDPRFSPAGVLAPKSKADLAFIMHSLAWLATNGMAAIVCFPGIMYRGGAEQKIRKYLIDNNFVDCVIQLPDNLFYGTSIATCIMVLKKSKSENSTLFIDASKEFVKVTNNNKLASENIGNILKLYTERQDVEHCCRLVNNAEVAENDYVLSVSNYVEPEDTREKIDIEELEKQDIEIQLKIKKLNNSLNSVVKGNNINELIQNLCPDGVEYKTLGDIATDIYRGSGIKRDEITDVGISCVRYGEIYTTYGIWFDKCVSHTHVENIKNPKYFEYGDILFAITGEKVEEISKSCAYIGNEKCLAGGDIVVLKHNQNPKYVSYALSTTEAQAQKSKGKIKSKVVHASMQSIKDIIIPIPPLSVQVEIVKMLDNLSKNTKELKELYVKAKEINEKKHKYYLDTLLNFKDISAT